MLILYKLEYHFMPNGNYSIDFQVYRKGLSFFTRVIVVVVVVTREVLASGICEESVLMP